MDSIPSADSKGVVDLGDRTVTRRPGDAGGQPAGQLAPGQLPGRQTPQPFGGGAIINTGPGGQTVIIRNIGGGQGNFSVNVNGKAVSR